MGELILRDIDETILSRLKEMAKSSGVSVEEEAKNIISNSIPKEHTREEAIAYLDEIREKYAHLQTTDSVDLIREDRDR